MQDENRSDEETGEYSRPAQTYRVRSRTTLYPISTVIASLLGLAFWCLVGTSIAAIFSPTVRHFFSTQWKWIVLSLTIGVVSLALIRVFETRMKSQSPEMRQTARALIVIPLIVLLVLGIVFLASAYQEFVVQVAFVMVVCLVPGAMYYLFIATRRPSILNEFIANLSRLGLFDATERRPVEQPGTAAHEDEYPDERRARVQGYFQKFEAAYGKLWFADGEGSYERKNFVDDLLVAVEHGLPAFSSGRLPQATVRLADMFGRHVLLPLGLATALSSLGWLLVLQPEWNTLAEYLRSTDSAHGGGGPVFLTPQWCPVNFAFLGAYFFGLQMLFRRFVRRDLGSNAYLSFSLRILLAVIGAWVVITCWAALTTDWTNVADLVRAAKANNAWPPALLVLGFVIGVFPRIIWQVISAVFVKVTFLKIALPSIESTQPLSDLDGLTVWHAARLVEEDIENVPNMATADVVDLLLHTQLPSERVISWVDQAILHRVLGPEKSKKPENTRRGKLRQHGIGCATELVYAYSHCSDAERAKLDGILSADGATPPPLRTIFRTIQLEPNYNLVRSWRRIA